MISPYILAYFHILLRETTQIDVKSSFCIERKGKLKANPDYAIELLLRNPG